MIRPMKNSMCNYLESRFSNLYSDPFKQVEKCFSDTINCLDLDEIDKRYLLSGSSDGTINIHDLWNFSGTPSYTAKVVSKVTKKNRNCHRQSCECVQWLPTDTGMFVTSGMDKFLKVWDTNAMMAVDVIKLEGRIYQHHISPMVSRRSLVAVATSSNNVSLFDLLTGSSTHQLIGHTETVICTRFSNRDENLLATAGKDHNIIFWDVRSAKSYLKTLKYKRSDKIESSHTGSICSLSFTSDGLYLLSLGNDKRLRLWNTFSLESVDVSYPKIPVESKRFYRMAVTNELRNNKVFVPSEGKIIVIDIFSGNLEKTLIGHHNYIHSCVYSDICQELYSGGVDQSVLVWSCDRTRNSLYERYLKERELNDVNYVPRNVIRPIIRSQAGTVYDYS
ncbi:DNA excision repair protein ERCC-8-like [Artemia franciscana]|uniref:DNA excision repair protein ERCC-8-like n=1 Tax=Artemia franciscana TaxID=6661 RepID=UPI0032DBDB4E